MNAEERISKLKCLLEELKDNREHAAHQYQIGGRGYEKLVTFAWDAVKDEIEEVGEDLALILHMAYGEVWRFNGIVDWDMIKDPLPSGVTLEILMDDQALQTKISLIIAEKKLSSYLAG
jgi:hypothetical protein